MDRANIAVRNFPLTAPQLRKKLKLADGGDAYLFGTTMQGGDHVLIRTAKISKQSAGKRRLSGPRATALPKAEAGRCRRGKQSG